jgi:hypothetical protein
MKTTEIKQILKANGVANVNVRKVKYMGEFQYGIFNWNLDEISEEKLTSLFPLIFISANGQAWL